jgi:DNA-binding response OmpR family regulator
MKRILIVEDNKQIREGLLVLVEREGFQVAGVADFDQAADLLRKDRFDLLLTDLDLPGGTGFELVRLAQTCSPKTASILVTAYGCTEVRKQAAELNLLGYFEKPYDPAALLRLVRSSLDGSRQATRTG